MDEHKLIRLAQNGDKAAFQSLIERYYPYITKFLIGLTGNPQETEDLTQDALLKLIRSIERFDPYGSATFSTWVMTIAKRTYIDYLRKNKHITVDIDELELAAQTTVEDEMIQKATIEEVLQAIETLPKEQAVAIRLRHLERQTLEEIAVKMNCQPKTVKSRIHNGMVKLRKAVIGGDLHG